MDGIHRNRAPAENAASLKEMDEQLAQWHQAREAMADTFPTWEEHLQHTPAGVPDHLLKMFPDAARATRKGLCGSGVKNPFQKRTASGKVVACLSSNPA